ncbi:MAG: cobalt ECF transporter T component CbiQ [Lachnospiraceae bacterium]|nr:cobalt ECF transporter T component CbiQ [Lachnospiraceae bacterium]
MNKAEKAEREILAIDEMSKGDSAVHRMSPLSKLLLTIVYIVITVSFNKYDITGIFIMILFPVVGYVASGVPVSTAFWKLRIVLPLVCAVGIINPFLDREILFYLGNIGISGGVVSFITLLLKGVFSLLASFLLVSTTSVEEICRALRQVHFPKILTSLFLLTFRYVHVLLEEVSIMTDAYHLRSPGQKGIHISAWGSFLGQLILRSSDRAGQLYDSMLLRGFQGEFYYAKGRKSAAYSWPVAIICIALAVTFRFINIAAIFGGVII